MDMAKVLGEFLQLVNVNVQKKKSKCKKEFVSVT
jgi:hypothetical protein